MQSNNKNLSVLFYFPFLLVASFVKKKDIVCESFRFSDNQKTGSVINYSTRKKTKFASCGIKETRRSSHNVHFQRSARMYQAKSKRKNLYMFCNLHFCIHHKAHTQSTIRIVITAHVNLIIIIAQRWFTIKTLTRSN